MTRFILSASTADFQSEFCAPREGRQKGAWGAEEAGSGATSGTRSEAARPGRVESPAGMRIPGRAEADDHRVPNCCSRSSPDAPSPEGVGDRMIVTANLPFSERTAKIPNARLCKAMLGG
jgi:hypothetical protein